MQIKRSGFSIGAIPIICQMNPLVTATIKHGGTCELNLV